MSRLPDDSQIESLRQKGKIVEVMKLRQMLRKDKQAICNDPPSSSEKYEIKLSLGDIIITATDGVYDNLFNKEVLDIIERFKRERYTLKKEQRGGLCGPPCFLSEP